MALQLTELDAYVYDKISPVVTDVIYATSPIFTRLSTKNAEKFSGNTRVRRTVIVGELNGDALGRGETMTIGFVTTDCAITCDLKVYWVDITLFGWDAMNNDGPEAIFNQVEMKFLNASLKMAKLMATNMYLNGQSAGRTKHLNGLEEWIDDGNELGASAFTSVGGQTRSDIQAVGTVGGLNAYTKSLTTFNLQSLNRAYAESTFGADHIDIVAATPAGFQLIWNGTQPAQRFASSDNDLAQVGFQNFKFNAADVVVDRYMPSGTNGRMFGLNTNYCEWWFSQVPLFQYGFTGFKGSRDSIDVSGQFLCGSNMMWPNPRTSFKLCSTLF